MKGVIIYFSGTGNTEYVANEFKKEFYKNNIQCDLIDVAKIKRIEDFYEFYVFGCPIHAEMFPYYYMDWIKDNLKNGNGKRTIIFSTQASSRGTGEEELRKVLEQRGFKVDIQQPIIMPNNYYIVGFKKTPESENEDICRKASAKVNDIVKKFLLGEEYIYKVPNIRLTIGAIAYKLFYKYSKNWPKKKLTVDYDRCIKCKKCQDNCPTKNIVVGENITFKSNCISCQKCINICPVNAFLYKNKHFEQYKLK